MMAMVKSGALDRFGEHNVLGSFKEASVRAWEIADEGGGDEAPGARAGPPSVP